jgi:hypothetical protein
MREDLRRMEGTRYTNIQDEDRKTGHESHVAMRSQDIVIPIVHL